MGCIVILPTSSVQSTDTPHTCLELRTAKISSYKIYKLCPGTALSAWRPHQRKQVSCLNNTREETDAPSRGEEDQLDSSGQEL